MLHRLDRLEIIIGQLTQSIKDLVKEHEKIRTELGGISTPVGFVLEDRAYQALPALLKQEFGLEIKGRLVRKYVKDKKGEQTGNKESLLLVRVLVASIRINHLN